jgi:2-C-methyl-D-erythritol 2,4-cyclodiphosphate synthase
LNNLIPYRIGLGFDAHRLKKGRKLILGGTEIAFNYGLAGHSDADVLLHALIDALLGALALPDIGTLFPDTDPRFRNMDSRKLLKGVLSRINRTKYRIAQIDSVLICDQPQISPVVNQIRQNLSTLIKVRADCIGIKAKTTEGTRLALPGKSISVLVIALLVKAK